MSRPSRAVRLDGAAGGPISRRALIVLGMTLSLLLAACSSRAPSSTPEGVVREFVERMRRVQGDPADAKAAYELLSKNAQANLKARAERYSAASGKAIAPEAMIVPSLFFLRFEPQRYRARISGGYALVEVQGLLPEERAQIQCVLEEDGWRLDLQMPPLPPIQTRPRENE